MILHRYLLREVLVPFGAGLLLLLQVIAATHLVQLNDVVLGPGASPADAGRIALYLAPHFLVLAVPVALLVGVMVGLGRLAEDGELVALGAAGRSPLQFYAVPVAIALVLGAGLAWVAREVEPRGVRAVRRHLNEAIKRNVAGDVQAGEFYQGFRRFTVYAEAVDRAAGDWRRVLVHDARGDGAPLLALAERGHLDPGKPGDAMRLLLSQGEVHRAASDLYSVVRFGEGEVALGISDHQTRKNPWVRPQQEMTPDELRAGAAAYDLGVSRFARRLLFAFHRKRAVALDCLVFALIAVPLSIAGGGGRGRAFVAPLGAFAAYYVIGRVAEALAEAGALAVAPAAFAAPALFALAGAGLYARIATGRAYLRRA